MTFDHEKLEVYQLALGFAAGADDLIDWFSRAATWPINSSEPH